MGVYECLPCFGRKRPQITQRATPSTRDLPSKSAHSTVNSFDTDPGSTKSQNFASTQDIPDTPRISKLNRALTVSAKQTYALIEDHPFPSLETDDEIIISSRAVGLNPIDWKSVDYNFCLPAFPWVTGREMAGIVEAVGPNVKDFKVGDRVWTSTYYKDSRAGCFQHFVAVPQHTVCHIPSNLSFESASCLGVAGLTAAMTLWKWLQIPRTHAPIHSTDPIPHPEYLLIWGGSSVTAQFAMQIASRSGVKVIAVASSKTKSLVESLGATYVVLRDGKSGDEIVAEIRGFAGNEITRAIDLVGTETAQYCLQALSTDKECIFAPLAMISSKAVVPSNVKVETVEMKQFVLNPASRVYALELGNLIEDGLVKLPSIDILEGGLDRVQDGLERLKRGDMEGRKLVVSFA